MLASRRSFSTCAAMTCSFLTGCTSKSAWIKCLVMNRCGSGAWTSAVGVPVASQWFTSNQAHAKVSLVMKRPGGEARQSFNHHNSHERGSGDGAVPMLHPELASRCARPRAYPVESALRCTQHSINVVSLASAKKPACQSQSYASHSQSRALLQPAPPMAPTQGSHSLGDVSPRPQH